MNRIAIRKCTERQKMVSDQLWISLISTRKGREKVKRLKSKKNQVGFD